MATSKPNKLRQPEETTCLEYLCDNKDEDNDSSDIASLSHRSCGYADLKTLTKKLENLEQNETSTQLEITEMKVQVEALKEDIDKVKERVVTAEMKQRGANCYAEAMKTERAYIALERDEVIREKSVMQERLRQVDIVYKRAETERLQMEKGYQDKLAELKCSHNKQNNTLQLWERELKTLKEENAELKGENSFLRATFFAVNPSLQDRQRLKCFSCKQSYSVDTRKENECTFHPLPPVPPSVWHRWQHGHLDKYRHSQCDYWSCCNTLSARGRRPEGCRGGPHHQRWEMDVMMKRVMLSRDILDETDDQKEPKIF